MVRSSIYVLNLQNKKRILLWMASQGLHQLVPANRSITMLSSMWWNSWVYYCDSWGWEVDTYMKDFVKRCLLQGDCLFKVQWVSHVMLLKQFLGLFRVTETLGERGGCAGEPWGAHRIRRMCQLERPGWLSHFTCCKPPIYIFQGLQMRTGLQIHNVTEKERTELFLSYFY